MRPPAHPGLVRPPLGNPGPWRRLRRHPVREPPRQPAEFRASPPCPSRFPIRVPYRFADLYRWRGRQFGLRFGPGCRSGAGPGPTAGGRPKPGLASHDSDFGPHRPAGTEAGSSQRRRGCGDQRRGTRTPAPAEQQQRLRLARPSLRGHPHRPAPRIPDALAAGGRLPVDQTFGDRQPVRHPGDPGARLYP